MIALVTHSFLPPTRDWCSYLSLIGMAPGSCLPSPARARAGACFKTTNLSPTWQLDPAYSSGATAQISHSIKTYLAILIEEAETRYLGATTQTWTPTVSPSSINLPSSLHRAFDSLTSGLLLFYFDKYGSLPIDSTERNCGRAAKHALDMNATQAYLSVHLLGSHGVQSAFLRHKLP